MTQLLASVLSVEEALMALEGGADIIDLKDARHGALGALPAETIRAAVEAVAGARPVSATAGDLEMLPEGVCTAVSEIAAQGVDFVKIGIFPGGDLPGCLDALAALAAEGTRLVAVMFADQAPDFDLIERLAARGFAGVMLDTAGKDGRWLGDHLEEAALAAFVMRGHRAGLFTGLAGSLRLEKVPSLLALAPDYLGFRGALTTGGRGDALDPSALAALRAAIARVHESQAGWSDAMIARAAAGAQQAAQSAISASAMTKSAKSL